MKKLISILCAAVLTVSLCVSSVAALGYGSAQEANYPDPAIVCGASMPAGGGAVGISEASEPTFVNNVVSSSKVSFDTPNPISGKRTMLTKSAINKLIKSGKSVEFKAADYSLILDGSKPDEGILKAVNLGCSIAKIDADAEYNGCVIPAGSLLVNFKQKGSFGFPAKLVLSAEGFESAALYKLDGTKVCDAVIEDGKMSFDNIVGGHYYIK